MAGESYDSVMDLSRVRVITKAVGMSTRESETWQVHVGLIMALPKWPKEYAGITWIETAYARCGDLYLSVDAMVKWRNSTWSEEEKQDLWSRLCYAFETEKYRYIGMDATHRVLLFEPRWQSPDPPTPEPRSPQEQSPEPESPETPARPRAINSRNNVGDHGDHGNHSKSV